jgi:hypothetical protein
MKLSFDVNLFTQIGLDSGALTMLGTIVHKFPEPGEYRGILYHDQKIQAIFRITVDKNIPVAQVNIDLATLNQTSSNRCEYCTTAHNNEKHFIVNLEGYALFHVSRGSGGYSVRIEKAEKDTQQKPFFTGELNEGDFFSAILLRPGTYSVTNKNTNARSEIVVDYPVIGKQPYRPPDPIRVRCTKNSVDPSTIKLKPTQGLIFQFNVPSRIRIELLKGDDGPTGSHLHSRSGWHKPVLPHK